MKKWPLYLLLPFVAFTSCAQSVGLLTLKAGLPRALKETSALVYTPQGLFTLSDNSRPEFHRLDTATGEIVQTITIRNIEFVDKEALAFDGTHFYIGDFGNNLSLRNNLKIVKVNARQISPRQDVEVDGQVIGFFYPEQNQVGVLKGDNAFDCEAMVVAGDSIFLFTKQRSDHQTTLYALPKTPGNYPANRKAVFDAKGRITDAALDGDGRTLLLLGYQKKNRFPFIWKFTGFEGNNFFTGNASHQLLTDEPFSWQTEGISFGPDPWVFVSCETTSDVQAALLAGDLKQLFP